MRTRVRRDLNSGAYVRVGRCEFRPPGELTGFEAGDEVEVEVSGERAVVAGAIGAETWVALGAAARSRERERVDSTFD
jgi:hypothetical protein